MFTGSVPQEARTLFQGLVDSIGKREFYLGCSGNFSVDKVIARLGCVVHSNDVSLYSKLVADILLETDTELKVLNADLKQVFAGWGDTRYKKLAMVMYAMKLSKFASRKNDYEKLFYDAYLDGALGYYEKTVKKLESGALDFRIKSFTFSDFLDFLKKKEGSGGIGVSFPPTYKAGYEKIYKFVEESFEYERATYELYDPADSERVFGDMLRQDENIFCGDQWFEGLQEYVVGKIMLGSGKHPLFVYSSVQTPKKFYYERSVAEVKNTIPVLPVDYEFTPETKITAEVVPTSLITYFKHFYMSARVDYTGGGDFGVIVYADGKAFGFCAFSKQMSTMTQCYLHSDFVSRSDTPKLSKLLIQLLKTNEVRRVITRKMMHRYDGLKTSVYTDKPVSMKYRGVFELERRDKGKLMYSCRFDGKTLDGVYQEWLTKLRKRDGKVA
ncbi:MAG: hypothetical protein HGB04_06670 [Chlorobiaceae bacterium]|nr:hypothetical protein [Chlorobiaceae bacterium]